MPPTKTPVQEKTPFAIDPRPLTGALTARAGLAAVSRVLRSLGIPAACHEYVPVRKRRRGYSSGEYIESLALLHASGGDCMSDMESLRAEEGMSKMLGYVPPGARAVGDFLEQFHDVALVEKARQEAQQQELIAFVPKENRLLEGLAKVVSESVHSISRYIPCGTVATVDEDGTIIDSDKRDALRTYLGDKGYQPLLALWAEASLVLADEFRDGNVPGQMDPLSCARAAFAALPKTVTERYFRGDSACHEHSLLNWLRDPQREQGPKGTIGFAISARMSEELAGSLRRVPEQGWQSFGTETDGTVRQWADLDFVPGERTEKKDIVPLRYIGLRLCKPQGELFADGSAHHYHAIVTNRTAADGGWILQWHREKAGTVERLHEELKNGLGAGRMPSGKFGANAAWLRIACIAYNVISALRQAWPDKGLCAAKPKRLRFEIFNVTGRFVRDRRKISLRLGASESWIRSLMRLFEIFPLATRSTG